MRASDRLALATFAATTLAMFTLFPITQDRSFVLWSLGAMILLSVITAILRRTPAGEAGALVGELVVLAAIAAGFAVLLTDEPGPLEAVREMAVSGVNHLATQSAPMDPNPAVIWLMVTTISTSLVLTDLLVSVLARPAWGLAPSLTLFLIPALALSADLSALAGIAVGAGYCLILLAEGINRTERWRRGVIDDPDHPTRSVSPVLWGSAAIVMIPAVALSLVAWLAIPTGSLQFVPGGRGDGGTGPLQLSDPTLDLRRNLNRPDDVPVLTYTTTPATDAENPDEGLYLRIASLPHLDANGWQNSSIDVLPGQPGRIPGVSVESAQRRHTEIQIGNFDSEYLPLPYFPRQMSVPGEWGYDPLSLIYISTGGDRGRATRNLAYSVDSVDLDPDGARLSVARGGSPDDVDVTGTVPEDLPDEIVDLALEITQDAPTDALKAAALQSYLRGGTFEYSTEPAPGSGYDALTNFLFEDQRGYCEQFAASMSVMARVIGIPSRVAIGFLPGEELSDGEWEVTTHDLHAWPELYFEGIGWTRWEPTPGNGTVPPAWTLEREGDAGETSAPPSSGEPTDEAVPTVDPTALPSDPNADPSEDPLDTDELPVARWGIAQTIGAVVALVVVVAILLIPGAVRSVRRRRRLSPDHEPGEAVEAAWAEVRDSVIDARGSWPSGSPRVIGNQLGTGLLATAAPEVAELAVLVERARYARVPAEAEHADLVALVSDIRGTLAEPASRGQRIRMALLPRSLWRSRAQTSRSRGARGRRAA